MISPTCAARLRRKTFWAQYGLSLGCLASCGGGGDSTNPPPDVTITAKAIAEGTLLSCTSPMTVSASLTPEPGGNDGTFDLPCPGTLLLPGGHAPTVWRVSLSGRASGLVQTSLPAPVLTVQADRAAVFRDWPLDLIAASGLRLEQRAASGAVIATWMDPATTVTLPAGSANDAQWRWVLTRGSIDFSSPWVSALDFKSIDTGTVGAMAVGDLDGGSVPRLLASAAGGDYAAIGLGALQQNRDFRDVRLVDLDNDGRLDVVSNVYGAGCLIVGMQRPGGGFDFQSPRRDDGSCIGGHGETIVVADFDRDGLVDIVLPSYERIDFLQNQGGGRFSEVADSLGISFPNYVPHVEGAAAVDINLDGAVDIVVGNEVLINDGHGRFSALPSPFGSTPFFDEGLSVADVDGDGAYDLVKNHPQFGPRVFWGQSAKLAFVDGGWLYNGQSVLNSSYGLAVGDLTGDGLPDLVISGGSPSSTAPHVCSHRLPRTFDCRPWEMFGRRDLRQDLLLFGGMAEDGSNALFARYWADGNPGVSSTIMQFALPSHRGSTFRFDMRDAAGRRTLFGRSLRASCMAGGAPIGLRFVDGGNGYMAQGDYLVTFSSAWCTQVQLESFSARGATRLGSFGPGTHVVTVIEPPAAQGLSRR